MIDPKGEKPGSEHPHEDDLSLELPQDQEGLPPAEEHPLNASTEEFHFSGPAEELDFTEPSDFAFPSAQPAEAGAASEHSGEFPAAEPAEAGLFFGPEGGAFGESPLPEGVAGEAMAAEAEPAGDGIADLEVADEPTEGVEKPKFELPRWVRIAEWVTVGLLAVGALLAVILSIVYAQDPKQVTLTLNIACPVMLGLIPYALWRSMPRWVTPAASAVYTVMLALSTAALIAGMWLVGVELSHYDWQVTPARVAAGKPRPGIIPPPAPAVAKNTDEPAAAPVAPKNTAEAAPAPAVPKGTAAPAAK